MSELLLYRTKKTERQVYFGVAALLLTVFYSSVVYSLVSLNGPALFITQFVSWGFLMLGIWTAIMVRAMDKSGYCRQIMVLFGKEFPYPGLDEWSEYLKGRGAFEVNYESE